VFQDYRGPSCYLSSALEVHECEVTKGFDHAKPVLVKTVDSIMRTLVDEWEQLPALFG
jgi:hypothetical protein